MAYEAPTLDTSTRNKLMAQADQFSMSDADIMKYLGMIRGEGQKSLQNSFRAAQADIGAQFSPAMRMAQSRLGGAGPMADSGYANRLNRQLQTASFGDLSRAYGNAAAQQGQSEMGALQNLINTRLGQRDAYLQAGLGGVQKKKNFGDYAMAGLGAAAGVAGSYLGRPPG